MSGFDHEAEAFESHPKWYLGSRMVLIIAFFVVVGIVLAVGHWAFSWWAAPYQGKLQARQQIQSGNYRIQAYTQFFSLCASVTTMDQALQQSYSDLKTASKGDKSRIETNITAQLNDRNDAANQYNTQSQESYTVGQFKASKLPYVIPAYKKGKVFSCVPGS